VADRRGARIGPPCLIASTTGEAPNSGEPSIRPDNASLWHPSSHNTIPPSAAVLFYICLYPAEQTLNDARIRRTSGAVNVTFFIRRLQNYRTEFYTRSRFCHHSRAERFPMETRAAPELFAAENGVGSDKKINHNIPASVAARALV
jgi:hypothetical protein